MNKTIDIHKLKPGDYVVGFGKVVKKVGWLLDSPVVEWEEDGTWDASMEKEVTIMTGGNQ